MANAARRESSLRKLAQSMKKSRESLKKVGPWRVGTTNCRLRCGSRLLLIWLVVAASLVSCVMPYLAVSARFGLCALLAVLHGVTCAFSWRVNYHADLSRGVLQEQ